MQESFYLLYLLIFAKKMNIELFDCLQKMKAERFQFLKNQSS